MKSTHGQERLSLEMEELSVALEADSFCQVESIVDNLIERLIQEPTVYKVMFFPYLAETWDALESIYEAFAEDERFITDIVIIPTFRPFSSVEKVSLYDDFLSNAGIPHTLYSAYDLAEDRPDLAFLNNPYDSVVSDPCFYIAKLRQYCQRLVYVPYYGTITAGYTEMEDKRIYNLPIHLIADKLIVQSELVANAYNHHCKGPKGRYIPLGTPKIDYLKKKVQKCWQNPKADWVVKINSRVTFLLDVHYRLENWNRFLPGGKTTNLLLMLLQAILGHFAANKNIFLIWRPHPLLFKAYSNNKEEFPAFEAQRHLLKLANGLPNIIIDMDSDWTMAASLSTAFISMGGSLKDLYPVLNKPVLYCVWESILPIGQQYFMPHNSICYQPPPLRILDVLHLRKSKAEVETLNHQKIEEESLSILDEEMRTRYESLLKIMQTNEIFSSDFLSFIKDIKPHPKAGYLKETNDYQNTYNRCQYLKSEIKEQIDSFEVELYRRHNVKIMISIIDQLANGVDPLKVQHQKAYRQALANVDDNCGRLVYNRLIQDFFPELATDITSRNVKRNLEAHAKKLLKRYK
jgi:hypothetical protein